MEFDFSQVVYFYSVSFIAFYLVVFGLYWSLGRFKNYVLLLASYSFYACWDYRFLSLIILSTGVDFWASKRMISDPSRKKLYLWVSVCVNLSILGVFKYAQFFVDSAYTFTELIGLGIDRPILQIILPLGISFYTFQTMSYVIDVYRNKFKPYEDILDFSLFVSYFPQLIAGPIERASHLLPEIQKEKSFNDIEWSKGIYLFAWGFFKKRAIADYMAYAVIRGYDPTDKAGILTLAGFFAYVFEVYGDISGYADMARGMSLLLGIRLSPNFFYPYFSRDPVEYWKRWHITLSIWARHYIFTPMITRLKNPTFAILATFTVMGIWHGPRWHYVHWGLYWAFWSIVYQRFLKERWNQFYMLVVIFIGQSFFRADSLGEYLKLWSSILNPFWSKEILVSTYYKTFFIISLLIIYEGWCYVKKDELRILKENFYVQTTFYLILIFLFRNLGETATVDFIYFQF